MNLLQALDDPAVFAPHFKDKSSWAAWRSFLCALFALPMDDEQLAIYRECTGRNEPPTEPVKEAWLCVGRKGGKSRELALIATYLAAFVDWSRYLSVGERGVIMVVAQDRAAAQVIMEYITENFRTVPMLAPLIERETADRLDLSNKISIRVHTCTIRGVRGPTVLCTLADEIAFWRDENSANPDEEVIASVRPAMATIGGGLLLCASSPYARKGALYQAYQKHYGKEGDPVLIWQAPTRRMNPSVPQSLIDAQLERDPARYTAEYMAEFRGDIEGFVALEVVQACIDAGVYERPPSDHLRYYGFVDPSGGSGSSFTLAIAHAEDGKGVLDAVREVKPPFDPSAVVYEFSDLFRQYRVRRIGGDCYAGQWPREAFRKQGITYDTCKDPRAILYQNLLPLLNSGTVRLLDNARLKSQLVSLERNTGRSGRDSIAPADNEHDDIANSVAGVLVNALVKKPGIRINGFEVGSDGKLINHPNPSLRSRDSSDGSPLRIRTVTVTEADMEKEGLRTAAEPTFKPFRRHAR